MSTILILEGGGYLWVYENIEEDYEYEQDFYVINGHWWGTYYKGLIDIHLPFPDKEGGMFRYANVKEVVVDFDRQGDYNEVITKLRIKRGEL